MNRWTTIAAGVVLVIAGSARAQRGPEADLSEMDRVLAAESLVHSAYGILLQADGASRAERLSILTEMACWLDGEHYEAHRLLADSYRGRQDHQGAAEALQVCLKSAPDDHAIWQLWVTNELAARQTAEDRHALLQQVIEDSEVPAAIRAEATLCYGDLLSGQGRSGEAEKAFLGALRFDPYQADALRAWESVQTATLNPVDRSNMMLRMLRANPMDVNTARDLAVLLGQVGLWAEARGVFAYGYRVGVRDLGDGAMPAGWLVAYCNALIDAGAFQEAAQTFAPMVERFPESLDLKMLLIEAYQQLNQPAKSRALIRSIEAEYDPAPSGPEAFQQNVNMSMFYLVARPDEDRAAQHVRLAIQQAGADAADSTLLQRLAGAAELASGATEDAVRRLTAIVADDAYAALFLARHYVEAGEPAAARDAIMAGVARGRSGPAYRLLRRLAHQIQLPIEPAPGTRQIKEQLATFGDLTLQMGLQPERFVDVSMATEWIAAAPGQPVMVTATLKNIGPVDVPIGQTGVLAASLAIRVTARSGDGDVVVFDRLPMIVWHSPRYLAPEAALTGSARIDVGALGAYLAGRPLETISLTVEGILDPVQRDGLLSSALPSVQIDPVQSARSGMLSDDGAASYDELIGAVRDRVASDDSADRMVAAGQIGMLLGFLAAVDDQRAPAPASVPQETMRDDLLSATRELLEDSSAAVRAEMLKALCLARPVDRLFLVGVVLDDPSPLVRLREAELIGLTSDSPDDERLNQLAEDDDPLVARMASTALLDIRVRINAADPVSEDSQ